MKFFMSVQMDNDAFVPDFKSELSVIIADAIKKIVLSEERTGVCMDHNGNTVGYWKVYDEKEKT